MSTIKYCLTWIAGFFFTKSEMSALIFFLNVVIDSIMTLGYVMTDWLIPTSSH